MSEKRNDPNALAAIFGKRLAELRKSHQMTQEELADKIGFSRAMISYYESWAKNPTLEVIQKVAGFFSVPPESLIATNGKEEKKAGPASRLEQQLQRVRRLNPHRQRMISNLIEVALNSK